MSTLPTQEPNFLYDLSNPHFKNTELLTVDNKTLKGRFVQFKVTTDEFESLYPAEKYCFVPEEKTKLFQKEFEWNEGAFEEFPPYVLQISMSQIKKITISPNLTP